MYTVVETPFFSKLWPRYWYEEERGAFAAFLAGNPDAGDVIPGTGGLRKVRWSRAGSGKSSGVRVIYYTRLNCTVGNVRQIRTGEPIRQTIAGD
ncbi:MAG: hypothetical protein WC091_19970 [Sulfuricellaceae bacterium]